MAASKESCCHNIEIRLVGIPSNFKWYARFLLDFSQLPGIIEIVPEAVEASHDGRFRGHKGVAHPDCKDCVLLPEGLSCGDTFVVMSWTVSIAAADKMTEGELKGAANKGHEGDEQHKDDTQCAVHYGFDRDSDGKGEGDCPDVESEVGLAEDGLVEGWEEISHQPGAKAWHYQQREHFCENLAEGVPEIQSACRLDEGDDCRDEDCREDVDEDGVGGDAGDVSTKFPCHYRGGGGRRADEA